MSVLIAIPLLLVSALLQVTILPEWRLLDGQLDLVFLIVLAWSLRAEQQDALIWAVIGAVLQDSLNPALPLAFSLLALLPSIFGMQALERNFYGLGWLAMVGFVVIATILHHSFVLFYFALDGYSTPISLFLLDILIPTLGLNLAGIFPIYWVLRRIQKRIPQSQSAWRVRSVNE